MVVCLSVSDGRGVSSDWGLISIGGIGCLSFLNFVCRYYGMGFGYISLPLSFYLLFTVVDKTCRSSVLWHLKMYGVSLVGVRKCWKRNI